MKFPLLCILCCFLSLSALAQQDSVKTWQLRWAITSLLDPRTPCLQVGLQKNITPRWAVSAEYGLSVYGFLLGKRDNNDTDRQDFHYQKLRAEIKYGRPSQSSAIDKNLRYQLYLGVEGLLIPERYNKQMDYFYRNNVRYEYSFSRIKNNIYVACLKGGIEWQYNRKWVVDMYMGLGLRFIHVQHYDTTPGDLPYTGIQWLAWFSPTPRDQTEGWHGTLHVALGLKLGYYLW